MNNEAAVMVVKDADVFLLLIYTSGQFTTRKKKFFTEDFFSKCDQIRSFLQIWSQLLKKSSMEKFIFVQLLKFFLPPRLMKIDSNQLININMIY